MPREKVTVTPAFKQAVAAYQAQHGLKSWSQALLHLAALGYEHETGTPPPVPFAAWGGWRGSEASIRALMNYADKLTDKGRNDPSESEDDE